MLSGLKPESYTRSFPRRRAQVIYCQETGEGREFLKRGQSRMRRGREEDWRRRSNEATCLLNWGKKVEHSLLKAASGRPVTVNENRRWCSILFFLFLFSGKEGQRERKREREKTEKTDSENAFKRTEKKSHCSPCSCLDLNFSHFSRALPVSQLAKQPP